VVEVEYKWYKEQGYTIYKINYNDFLDCLPPTPIKEIVVSKEWLRDNAYSYKREYGATLLAYCPDRNFICLATYDPSLDIAYVLIWKPS